MPKRVKLYRPRVRDSKTKRKIDEHNNMMVCVRQWWEETVRSGKLYSIEETKIKRTDYIGVLPWPDMASFVSMYQEFMLSYGNVVNCSPNSFAHYLHRCTPLKAGECKSVSIRTQDDKLLWKSGRNFIELPRLDNA